MTHRLSIVAALVTMTCSFTLISPTCTQHWGPLSDFSEHRMLWYNNACMRRMHGLQRMTRNLQQLHEQGDKVQELLFAQIRPRWQLPDHVDSQRMQYGQGGRQHHLAVGRMLSQLAESPAKHLPVCYSSRESRQSPPFEELQLCQGLSSMGGYCVKS